MSLGLNTFSGPATAERGRPHQEDLCSREPDFVSLLLTSVGQVVALGFGSNSAQSGPVHIKMIFSTQVHLDDL